MLVVAIFALIFYRIDFMTLISLTTGNKNPSNLVPVPAIYCAEIERSLRTKSTYLGGGGGCKRTIYIGLGAKTEKILFQK